MVPVKDESWLAKVGKRLEMARIFQELVPERHVAPRSVMKDVNCAAFSPFSYLLWPKLTHPEPVKVERGSEQDQSVYFRVASRI